MSKPAWKKEVLYDQRKPFQVLWRLKSLNRNIKKKKKKGSYFGLLLHKINVCMNETYVP